MTIILPQSELIDELVRQADAGVLPHALILHGPEGIGKTEAACRAVLEILGHDAARSPGNPRAVAHPDFCLVQPDASLKTRPIPIEAVRQALSRLRMKAIGGRRFLVVEDAERAGPGAQDALLKTLEEPPHGAHVILITSRLSGLKATLRSRSRTLALRAPDNATAILRALDPKIDATRAARLVAMTGGSPGKALAYEAQDAPAIALEIDHLLGIIGATGKLDRVAAHALAAKVGPDGFSLFAELVDQAFHRLSLWAAHSDLKSRDDWPGAALLLKRADTRRIARLAQISRDIETATQTQSLDKAYGVIRTLIAFERLIA